ncbi:MAG: ABC transporter ATP-binding protein [Pirellulales bacterium]
MIQIRDVHKSYQLGHHEVRALRGVSCEVPTGAFAFVVGPSGSGKSTLLYLLGALDRPTSGSVQVDGRELSRCTPAEADQYRRHQVGFVFQAFNLISNLTALENVLVPYLPDGVDHQRRAEARRMLEQVGLGDRLDHRPNQLSGGEQQRVAIARALLKRPSLVLADEPTGELDSDSAREVYRHLRGLLAEQQSTVLVVTHDERFIHPGDLVLRLGDGQLLGRYVFQEPSANGG